jgi:hypothetical protein
VATLVGIKAAKPGQPALTPFGGYRSAADRLRELLGMSVEEFLRTFPRRENVIEGGRSQAGRLRAELTGLVFVLGLEAWSALKLPTVPWFAAEHIGRARWVLLPHPSGRNRLYNEQKRRERLRRVVWGHLGRSASSSTSTTSPSRGRGSPDQSALV